MAIDQLFKPFFLLCVQKIQKLIIFWKNYFFLLFGWSQRGLANVRMFLGISVEKRKKNVASLLERRISTGYSRESQGYACLNQAYPVFPLFSMDIPRNIPRLARGLKRVCSVYWCNEIFKERVIILMFPLNAAIPINQDGIVPPSNPSLFFK